MIQIKLFILDPVRLFIVILEFYCNMLSNYL